MKIEGAAFTHVGKVRSNNEDNYYLFGNYRDDINAKTKRDTKNVRPEQMLAGVYDGMGGEAAGEIASLMAARMFMPCRSEYARDEVVRQIKNVNKEICREVKRHNGTRMGTTAALLYLDDDTAVCGNIGDSRCYFMRNGTLRQLSVDHTEAWQKMSMGLLSPQEARQSKSWHKLTQHLGIFPEEFVIEPHVSAPVKLQPGDIFLLCSDGLTDMVMDEEIAEILDSAKNAEMMADALVETALTHGGRDNITAIVLQVKDDKSDTGVQKKRRIPGKQFWIAGILIFLLAILAGSVMFYKNRKEESEKTTTETEVDESQSDHDAEEENKRK